MCYESNSKSKTGSAHKRNMLFLVLLHWRALTLQVVYLLFVGELTKQMDVPCCIVQCLTSVFPRCFASVLDRISLSITDNFPTGKQTRSVESVWSQSLPRPTESTAAKDMFLSLIQLKLN